MAFNRDRFFAGLFKFLAFGLLIYGLIVVYAPSTNILGGSSCCTGAYIITAALILQWILGAFKFDSNSASSSSAPAAPAQAILIPAAKQ